MSKLLHLLNIPYDDGVAIYCYHCEGLLFENKNFLQTIIVSYYKNQTSGLKNVTPLYTK